MDSRRVIRRLQADGWILDRVVGSHHIFKKPAEMLAISVPHLRKDVSPGVLRQIGKIAGWKD